MRFNVFQYLLEGDVLVPDDEGARPFQQAIHIGRQEVEDVRDDFQDVVPVPAMDRRMIHVGIEDGNIVAALEQPPDDGNHGALP